MTECEERVRAEDLQVVTGATDQITAMRWDSLSCVAGLGLNLRCQSISVKLRKRLEVRCAPWDSLCQNVDDFKERHRFFVAAHYVADYPITLTVDKIKSWEAYHLGSSPCANGANS